MRKCDEHQTLVHLDVHVCPVFVCVCMGGGGGGGYSHLFIYMKIPPDNKIKIFYFEPQKWSEPTYV